MIARTIILFFLLIQINSYFRILLFSQSHNNRNYYKDLGFSIIWPQSWEIKDQVYQGNRIPFAISKIENSKDTYRENVNIYVDILPKSITLNDYYNLNMKQISQDATEIKDFKDGKGKINKKESRWISFMSKVGSLNINVVQYFVINSGRGFIITCSSANDDHGKFKAIFDRIIKSFRFE